MQRQIKFRAWFKPTDYDEDEPKKPPRMVYFDEWGYCDEYNHLAFQVAKSSLDPQGGPYGNLGASGDNFLALMQFTGLLDKNGREIYEGDLLKWKEFIWEVVYDSGESVRIGVRLQGQSWIDIFFGKTFALASEIVGNIYEHPDLLTKPGGTK